MSKIINFTTNKIGKHNQRGNTCMKIKLFSVEFKLLVIFKYLMGRSDGLIARHGFKPRIDRAPIRRTDYPAMVTISHWKPSSLH